MQVLKSTLSRRAALTVLIGAAGGVSLVGGTTGVSSLNAEPTPTRGDVNLYKNPECGCCEGYADYLRQQGFKVTAVPTHDLTVMGENYGIPDSPQPCHISLIGGYVVGGHIPIEIVNRLLSEKPQITGITLPGMPVGTPGMPGNKPSPLDIYEIGKGQPKVYATI